jgi:hypothetical protein
MPEYRVGLVHKNTHGEDFVPYGYTADELPAVGDAITLTQAFSLGGEPALLASAINARVTKVDAHHDPPIHADEID